MSTEWTVRKSIYGWVIDPVDLHVGSGTKRTDAEANALAQRICDDHAHGNAVKQLAERLGGAELAELRAYKERTEAALAKLSADNLASDTATGDLRNRGLWRDPQPGEVKP